MIMKCLKIIFSVLSSHLEHSFHIDQISRFKWPNLTVWFRFVNDVESKLQRSTEVENPKDLATCNRLLLDQQRLEDQLDNRRQELSDIREDAGEGMQDRIDQISNRIDGLIEPLASRRERIQTAKHFHQLRRDIQDEIMWCEERIPLAESTDYGRGLHNVQKLVKRNEVRKKSK